LRQRRPSLPDFSRPGEPLSLGILRPAKAEGSDEEILKIFRQGRDEIKGVFEAYGAGRRDGAKKLA
jgi:hypothetical protein